MFWDIEITPEEEEEMIEKVAVQIHEYGMDVGAILMLESVKPLAFMGGQMGRFILSPFLLAFGESISRGGDKFFTIFEKHENVEKLISLLEKMAKEEKPKEAEKPKEEQAILTEKPPPKKGWRRFLPF